VSSAEARFPLVEFMYLVFMCVPGESYRRRLRSLLLYLPYVFGALINSLVFRPDIAGMVDWRKTPN